MKIIFHPFFIIFFTLCIIAFSLPMYQRDTSSQIEKERIAQLEKKRIELTRQKEQLEYKKFLSEQRSTGEKVIRDQLWKQKAGETIISMVDFQPIPDQKAPEIEDSIPSNLELWHQLLFEN